LTHPSNIDRLWAIWQALNPNSYVIDKVAQAREANFTIAANTKLTGDSELKPFYTSAATNFWKASDVKNTTPFNYAYPETQRWLYPNDQAYQAAVKRSVTTQYGGNVINNFFENIAPRSASATAASVTSAAPALTMNFMQKAVAHPVKAAQEVLGIAKDATAHATSSNGTSKAQASNPAAPSVQATSAAPPVQAQPAAHAPAALNVPKEFEHLVPNRTYTEYITNLRALKHGLQQTFRVYVFLGDFNPDPTTWPTEHNVVGRFTVLGRAGTTQCEKCQSDSADDLVVTGTVPLTSALLQDIVESSSSLRSLEPSEVVPYLERNLHWRVTVFDGTERPREEVPGLKVAVVSTKVRIGDDGVPVYSGEYDAHPEITDGRPAGLGAGDEV
jgi:tyrosinase